MTRKLRVPTQACKELCLRLEAACAAGERAASESIDDATSQVKIKEAFASPDNLQNCLGFLRQYAADRKAQAACAVVPADQIAYPQVCSIMALLHAMV